MKTINKYIIEKLKITKNTKYRNVKELYDIDDTCLRLWKLNNDSISCDLVLIDSIDWDKQKCYMFTQDSNNDYITFSNRYSYSFKKPSKYKYLTMAKGYGVEEKQVIIPMEESIAFMENAIKNKKITLDNEDFNIVIQFSYKIDYEKEFNKWIKYINNQIKKKESN